MVFSSLEFIYLFLPPVLLGYLALRAWGRESAIIWWLIAASLAFYAWWSPIHLLLLIGSVLANFGLHRMILRTRSKPVLAAGIAGNLATLAYFKYADFLIGNINLLPGADLPALGIILPLAISFFTFQQISFLCDTWRGEISECDFSRYCLFVVFFPQLIAGPIVLQKDTIPQFTLKVFQSKLFLNLAVGGTLFAIGLFKKIVLADGIAPLATSVFSLADAGHAVPAEAAWIGALAYTFQIYFDFSGYCDMALGLARMFGIRLPINFNSPYKATSIVDFWRRWHITLSRFLRDYLYIPLGGNRHGRFRRYLNLFATMVLGGLWHGASWNFVLWGALHGVYLAINHAWSAVFPRRKDVSPLTRALSSSLAQGLTMLAVIFAWVPFRAETLDGALAVMSGMLGFTELYDVKAWSGVLAQTGLPWVQFIALALVVFYAPNSIELVRKYRPVIDAAQHIRRSAAVSWRPSRRWAMAVSGVFAVALLQVYRLGDLTEFIYFNF
ncbi:MAG: MBOAT family protein [Pseudomonadota bacterium]